MLILLPAIIIIIISIVCTITISAEANDSKAMLL